MDYVYAILAGAVQGLTEFLPISSTAHLIIFQKVFNLPQDKFGLGFDASIHLGTLMAILVFFFKDYLKIFKNNLYAKLAIGTIPAVVAGLFLENMIENELRSLTIVGASLVIFSLVIWYAEKVGKRYRRIEHLSVQHSLIIGVAQALALIPGVSRSGSTISAALFLGQERESAARFAFLLSGPIVAGAGLKKFIDALTSSESSSTALLVIGIFSSFFFGYLTIKYFLKYISTRNLYPFIIYRVIIGTLLLLLPFLIS